MNPSTTDKVRQNLLRRMAERQALRLTKSRRRDPRAFDYGGWWLIDTQTGETVLGGRAGLGLDAIEAHLTGTVPTNGKAS